MMSHDNRVGYSPEPHGGPKLETFHVPSLTRKTWKPYANRYRTGYAARIDTLKSFRRF